MPIHPDTLSTSDPAADRFDRSKSDSGTDPHDAAGIGRALHADRAEHLDPIVTRREPASLEPSGGKQPPEPELPELAQAEVPQPELRSGGTAGSVGPFPETDRSDAGPVGDPMESFDRQRSRREPDDLTADDPPAPLDTPTVFDEVEISIRRVIETVFGDGAPPLLTEPTDPTEVADHATTIPFESPSSHELQIDHVADAIADAVFEHPVGSIGAAVEGAMNGAADLFDDNELPE